MIFCNTRWTNVPCSIYFIVSIMESSVIVDFNRSVTYAGIRWLSARYIVYSYEWLMRMYWVHKIRNDSKKFVFSKWNVTKYTPNDNYCYFLSHTSKFHPWMCTTPVRINKYVFRKKSTSFVNEYTLYYIQ